MRTCCYVLLCFILISCTSNTIYREPKDLIAKDSMILLLTDMYIATSAKNVKNKFNKKNKNYMSLVYEKYKIDSTRFYRSNNYYTSKIEPYTDILDSVKKNIKVQLDSFEIIIKSKDSIKKAKRKIIRDSIKKAKKVAKELAKKKDSLLTK